MHGASRGMGMDISAGDFRSVRHVLWLPSEKHATLFDSMQR